MLTPNLIERLAGSGLTLYMLAIIVRWTAPWLELELHGHGLQWIPRITDPYLTRVRQGLLRLTGSLEPMDWSPVAALLLVWFVRLLYPGY